jgi:hypothetical protein
MVSPMDRSDVPFRDVLTMLEAAGYQLAKVYGEYRYFVPPGSRAGRARLPGIGFPVEGRRVKRAYVERIREIIQASG